MQLVNGKRLTCVDLGMASGQFTIGNEYTVCYPLLVEHPYLARATENSTPAFCTVEDDRGRRTLFTEVSIEKFFAEPRNVAS